MDRDFIFSISIFIKLNRQYHIVYILCFIAALETINNKYMMLIQMYNIAFVVYTNFRDMPIGIKLCIHADLCIIG